MATYFGDLAQPAARRSASKSLPNFYYAKGRVLASPWVTRVRDLGPVGFACLSLSPLSPLFLLSSPPFLPPGLLVPGPLFGVPLSTRLSP